MSVDPTVVKQLAMLFLSKTSKDFSSITIGRTVSKIKELYLSGYTFEEIEYGINYALKTNKNVYSIGYVTAIMPKALEMKTKAQYKAMKIDVPIQMVTKTSEVEINDKTKERNREKLRRFGVQSRKRTEHYFDMFEGE